MRLSCKQLAEAWGIAVTKVRQAREPAFRKVARAMILFPAETAGEVAFYMETLIEEKTKPPRHEDIEGRGGYQTIRPCPRCGSNGVEPLSERELRLRELMNEGRVDRAVIHPMKT